MIFEKICRENPQHVKACYFLGMTLVSLQKLEEAEEVWQEAIQNNQGNKDFFLERIQFVKEERYKNWVFKIAQQLQEGSFDAQSFSEEFQTKL